MRDPAFWWREAGLAARLLTPIAALYGAATSARLARPGARAAVPVVCVGNPTLGGAGKTPLVLTLTALLQAAGEAPALLSRGYGGRLVGPFQVDTGLHRAADVGDEPLLLARSAPTIVARDRVAGAAAAVAAGANLIVMDDGFQIRRCRRISPCSWSTRAAASATDGCSRRARCVLRSARSLRAPTHWWWSVSRAVPMWLRRPRALTVSRFSTPRWRPTRPRSLRLPARGSWPSRASAIRKNCSRRSGVPASRSRRPAASRTIIATRPRTREPCVTKPTGRRSSWSPPRRTSPASRVEPALAVLAARARALPVTLALSEGDALLRLLRAKLQLRRACSG